MGLKCFIIFVWNGLLASGQAWERCRIFEIAGWKVLSTMDMAIHVKPHDVILSNMCVVLVFVISLCIYYCRSPPIEIV